MNKKKLLEDVSAKVCSELRKVSLLWQHIKLHLARQPSRPSLNTVNLGLNHHMPRFGKVPSSSLDGWEWTSPYWKRTSHSLPCSYSELSKIVTKGTTRVRNRSSPFPRREVLFAGLDSGFWTRLDSGFWTGLWTRLLVLAGVKPLLKNQEPGASL